MQEGRTPCKERRGAAAQHQREHQPWRRPAPLARQSPGTPTPLGVAEQLAIPEAPGPRPPRPHPPRPPRPPRPTLLTLREGDEHVHRHHAVLQLGRHALHQLGQALARQAGDAHRALPPRRHGPHHRGVGAGIHLRSSGRGEVCVWVVVVGGWWVGGWVVGGGACMPGVKTGARTRVQRVNAAGAGRKRRRGLQRDSCRAALQPPSQRTQRSCCRVSEQRSPARLAPQRAQCGRTLFHTFRVGTFCTPSSSSTRFTASI